MKGREREESRTEARKPKVQKADIQKCLDYRGNSLWGKGNPAPELMRAGYASHIL